MCDLQSAGQHENTTSVECLKFLKGANVIRVLLLLEFNVADSCSLPRTLLVFWLPSCHKDSVINDPGHSDSCLRRPFILPRIPLFIMPSLMQQLACVSSAKCTLHAVKIAPIFHSRCSLSPWLVGT